MKTKYKYLIIISFLVILLDQATKNYVHYNFHLGESVTVVKNYFSISYVRNPGSAFSFMASAPKAFREGFFYLLIPLAMGVIFYMLRNTPDQEKYQIAGLSLVFGGATGNYIDRIRFQGVIDFLDFHWHRAYTWPTFNVADIAIDVGIGILILFTIKAQIQEWKTKGPSKTT